MEEVFEPKPAHEVLVGKVEWNILERARFACTPGSLHQNITVACALLEALRESIVPAEARHKAAGRLELLRRWAENNLPPVCLPRETGARAQIVRVLLETEVELEERKEQEAV